MQGVEYNNNGLNVRSLDVGCIKPYLCIYIMYNIVNVIIIIFNIS